MPCALSRRCEVVIVEVAERRSREAGEAVAGRMCWTICSHGSRGSFGNVKGSPLGSFYTANRTKSLLLWLRPCHGTHKGTMHEHVQSKTIAERLVAGVSRSTLKRRGELEADEVNRDELVGLGHGAHIGASNAIGSTHWINHKRPPRMVLYYHR